MAIITRTAAIYCRYIARTVSPPLSSHISDRFLCHRSVPKPLSLSSHHPIYEPFQFHRSFSFSSSPDYPSGDLNFIPHTSLNKLLVKFKTLIAPSSERIPPGSILQMDLCGQIYEHRGLPEIRENLLKAAYDPRIYAVYVVIWGLECGWAKLDEIRTQISNFRQSGKPIVAYVPVLESKDYYIACACEEVYTCDVSFPVSLFKDPHRLPAVTHGKLRIRGLLIEDPRERLQESIYLNWLDKYKRAVGGQLMKDYYEMTSALQDSIYSNWLDKVSSSIGKKREDIENFINEGDGFSQVYKLKEEGFISNIVEDQTKVITSLIDRFGVKSLCVVYSREYSLVRKCTVGISGGKEVIAVIHLSGSINRRTIGQEFIDKIREVSESKKFKAVIIRIDSMGGDILHSSSLWTEIRSLAAKKPVITSMSDLAMGAAYYVAMGAGVIVAHNLTLTGSIGVDFGNFMPENENIDEILKLEEDGTFYELNATKMGSSRPCKTGKFAESLMYKQFRDDAALSRPMIVDKMEEVAHGRIWTGKDAASHGLVDAIGGLTRAIAIAKLKANIPQNRHVTIVELSIHSTQGFKGY